ncbi:hypothetical protein QF035_004740 [Streptomyces umbrinus]|uniref:CYTH domain-containing protein n=1 Tax=Streptomyces umbrinus TaxID=67370 RepID=A0ABU0SUJ6_9ACTN|nr:hypothetical protein [Streptomyces umbrinus]
MKNAHPAQLPHPTRVTAETIARLRLHDAGLCPESQAELRTLDGRRRYVDFLFRAEGPAVEIEGLRTAAGVLTGRDGPGGRAVAAGATRSQAQSSPSIRSFWARSVDRSVAPSPVACRTTARRPSGLTPSRVVEPGRSPPWP